MNTVLHEHGLQQTNFYRDETNIVRQAISCVDFSMARQTLTDPPTGPEIKPSQSASARSIFSGSRTCFSKQTPWSL